MKRNLIYHTLIPLDNDIPVFTCRDGSHITRLDAIARDGALLSADRKTLDQLLPNHAGIAPKQAVTMELSFSLGTAAFTVNASCRLIAVRRLCRERYELKLVFDSLEEHAETIINDFVESALHIQEQRKVA